MCYQNYLVLASLQHVFGHVGGLQVADNLQQERLQLVAEAMGHDHDAPAVGVDLVLEIGYAGPLPAALEILAGDGHQQIPAEGKARGRSGMGRCDVHAQGCSRQLERPSLVPDGVQCIAREKKGLL